MRATIRFGRILGIEVGVHYSWFLIAVLITVSLAGHFHEVNADWGDVVIWIASIITGVLFFAGVLVHELAHSVVARARGGSVRSITLFALGGMAQIDKDVEDASTEFLMAIAGPLTSGAIGCLCLGAAATLGWRPHLTPATPTLAVLVWLGYINISLGIFNMIPGFPLDGGRVFRAIIWWFTRSRDRATAIAARVGQAVALLFILYGLWGFFGGRAGYGGLWLALIGWFLLEASRSSLLQMQMVARLAGVTAADVMARDCPVVDSRLSLQAFVQEQLLRGAEECYVVKEDGYVVGVVTTRDVTAIPKGRWPATTVKDAMRPLARLKAVTSATPLMEALETMGRYRLRQMPVVDGGELQGILTRGHILQVLEAREQLKA